MAKVAAVPFWLQESFERALVILWREFSVFDAVSRVERLLLLCLEF